MAQPLRRQIVFFNIAILVPMFAVLAWSAQATYREQINHLEAESRAMAATVVALFDRGLPVASVQTVISAIPLPTGAVITVTDAQSVVLARSRNPEKYVGTQLVASPLPMAEVPKFVIREGVDGVERVFANALFSDDLFLVSVGIPTAVANERVAPIFRRNLIIVAGVTIFALLLQFLLLRPYTRAFDRAIKFAGRVAAGDLTAPAPAVMPSLEMERLQASVIVMLARLREAQEAVAAQVVEERRMRQEVESLQRQVIRQERLAAIGLLVSGVAHELNNPLQAILGFAELLQIRKDVPAQIGSELALIQKESARASAIIRNLSRFSRQQSAVPSPVRLRDVVASVIELRQRKLEEDNIELDVNEEGDPPVLAVFQELQQVVLNFMINAEQAVMETPVPRRIVVNVTGSQSCARLEVHDTGPGVPPESEAKLFQPFFTTKPVGEGTGLGLSVSYGIIQSHNGTIGYYRGTDGGAVFYFELPALGSAAQPS